MRRKYAGHKPDVGVYIDDVFYGKPPQNIEIAPGVHEIGLFNRQTYESADPEDKERMNGSFLKLNFNPNKATKIVFQYNCRTGINFICNDNEWSFSSEVTEYNN